MQMEACHIGFSDQLVSFMKNAPLQLCSANLVTTNPPPSKWSALPFQNAAVFLLTLAFNQGGGEAHWPQ